MLCAVMFCIPQSAVKPADDELAQWESFPKTADAKVMISWMHSLMRSILSGEKEPERPDIKSPEYYGRLGIFVTLVRQGKTRGCFGAFHHTSDNITAVLRDYLRGALRSDPRYAPLELHECAETKVVVTIASQAQTINDASTVDLSRYGVKVTCESEEVIVFVPFEVKTYDYLRRSLKGRAVQEYAVFRAVTIR